MKLRGFYKGRYMIAIYDEHEHLSFLADNIKELAVMMGVKVGTLTKRVQKGWYHLIDLEPTADIFKEEDELFVEEIIKGGLYDKKHRRSCL